MKSLQDVCPCASFQLCLLSLTSCHEILFRMWVLCFSSTLSLISDLLPWNPFQDVSPCALSSVSYLWPPGMKSHSACGSLCFSSALSDLWPSAMKSCSACESLCFPSALSDLWSPVMKFLSGCESLCFSSALFLIFDLLPYSFQFVGPCASSQLSLISDLLSWNPFQGVSPGAPLSSVSDLWSSGMKSCSACESLCFSLSFSLWPPVTKFLPECESQCFSSALFLISDILPWNPF